MRIEKINSISWGSPGAVYYRIWSYKNEIIGERLVGEVISKGNKTKVSLWSMRNKEPYRKTFPLTELNELSVIRLYQETVKEMQDKTGRETWL